MPEDETSRTARLLLKALDSLPERERQQVLRFLIERALVARDPQAGAERSAPGAVGLAIGEPARFAMQPLPSQQRMLPVRLPERDHDRLKAWCARHDFPMAVVIRGLVERFLDAQGEAPS